MPQNSGASYRNRAGKTNVALYILGVLSLSAGVYLAGYTRINLVTAQSSSPFLPIGIVLAIVGLILVVTGRSLAKRNLSANGASPQPDELGLEDGELARRTTRGHDHDDRGLS